MPKSAIFVTLPRPVVDSKQFLAAISLWMKWRCSKYTHPLAMSSAIFNKSFNFIGMILWFCCWKILLKCIKSFQTRRVYDIFKNLKDWMSDIVPRILRGKILWWFNRLFYFNEKLVWSGLVRCFVVGCMHIRVFKVKIRVFLKKIF